MVVLYFSVGFATLWVAGWWPHEKILLYLNGFLTQAMFLLIIWLLMRLRGWKWEDFGWKPLRMKKYIGSVLSLYFLTWIINIAYSVYMYQRGFNPPDTDVYTQLLGNATIVTFILNLLLAGILAPIMEETIFRGIIFGSLQTYLGKWTSAALSAAIFSGLHLQAYGFLPRFVLGMVLAFLYMRHKSIYPSVAMHALNNIAALVLATLAGSLI